jgi:hypothetical protein
MPSTMGSDVAGFLRSLTPASIFRLVLTVALTTGSVLLAYRDAATPALLIACNAITIAGTIFMEYRNYQARR